MLCETCQNIFQGDYRSKVKSGLAQPHHKTINDFLDSTQRCSICTGVWYDCNDRLRKLGAGKLGGGPLEDEEDIQPPATTYQFFPAINSPDLSLWIAIPDKVFIGQFILSRLDCMLHVTFIGE